MFPHTKKRKAEDLAVAAGSAMEEGDIETAIGLANAATKLYDHSGKVWFIHGQVMQLAEQYEDALESYAAAKACEPDKAALAIYNQGKVYEDLQQWDQAFEAFDTVVELDPEDADAWVNRGMALAEVDRHLEAIVSYDRALKLSPDDVDAWANKGNSLQVTGKLDDAIVCYNSAINIDPENLASHYGLCESLYHQEQYEESLNFAENALQLDPTLAPAWVFKAISLSQQGHNRHALDAIEKAAVLEPESPETWNNRGEILGLLNRLDEARESFERALNLDKKCAAGWFGIARIHCFRGAHEAALDCFDGYFRLAPETDALIPAAQSAYKLCCETLETQQLVKPDSKK